MNVLRIGALALASTLVACGSEPKALPEGAVVKGVNFVGIAVADLDAATEFYQAGTDLEIVDEASVTGSSALDTLARRTGVAVETRMLRTVNAQINLMSFAEPTEDWEAVPVQGPGIMHVCFQVDQNTQSYQKFLAAGGEFLGEEELVQLNPRNPVYYGYFEDLDGSIIEIEHVDIEALNLDSPPPHQYRMRHFAFTTPDVDRLAAFYSVLLEQPDPRRVGGRNGFASERVDAITGLKGSTIRMAWFQVRNLELEITSLVSHPTTLPEPKRPVDAPGLNMVVFDVDDLDAAVELFQTAGGTIETDVEDFHGAPTVFGRDPDGNIIGLQAAATDAVVSSRNFSGNGTE
ncbi:MAG: VOC family protein [Pseudomonadota bacterium]